MGDFKQMRASRDDREEAMSNRTARQCFDGRLKKMQSVKVVEQLKVNKTASHASALKKKPAPCLIIWVGSVAVME